MTHTCPGCGNRSHPLDAKRLCPYHWGKSPVERSNAQRVAEILAWAETPKALRVWPPVGR